MTTSSNRRSRFFSITSAALLLWISPAVAETSLPEAVYDSLSPRWSGHLRFQGNLSHQDSRSIYKLVCAGTYADAAGEMRLKNQLYFGDWGVFETHYEAVLSGGDSRRKGRELEELLMGRTASSIRLSGVSPLEDDRRLMDLTKIIDDGDSHVFYHRLDRMFLTLERPWGTLTAGRQALTWGHGMLFNPMDLFNPFAPTDVIRDYKVGDDMVTATTRFGDLGSLQTIYVARRDTETGDVDFDSSAVAAKWHFSSGATEFDLMTGRNYENTVLGAGAVGYIGDAAWRADATYTFLPSESDKKGYWGAVFNLDYSWIWWEKNFYGYLETYYNGLGDDDYQEAITDPVLSDALARGELFTLGRLYIAGMINMEVHPLLNFYATIINNFTDPSGVIQPRFVWSVTQNIDALVGGTIHYGGRGTESGGFKLPGTDLLIKPADSAYVWVTWYF